MNKTALVLFTMLAPSIALASTTPYFGVNVGYGGIENIDFPSTQNINYSEKSGSLSYGLNGGIMFDTSFSKKFQYGIEIGYQGYATNEYKLEQISIDYDGYNIALMGIAQYQFLETLKIRGKLGAAYTTQEVNLNNFITIKENEILPKIGINLSYDITKQVSFDLGFEHIFGDDTTLNTLSDDVVLINAKKVASVSSAYVGMTYHF